MLGAGEHSKGPDVMRGVEHPWKLTDANTLTRRETLRRAGRPLPDYTKGNSPIADEAPGVGTTVHLPLPRLQVHASGLQGHAQEWRHLL